MPNFHSVSCLSMGQRQPKQYNAPGKAFRFGRHQFELVCSENSQRPGFCMLTLYSYPTLFGVADNNGYGLKVFAFLRLAGVPFHHEHIFDASSAPRGQLPTSSMTERRSATVTPSSPTSSLSTG